MSILSFSPGRRQPPRAPRIPPRGHAPPRSNTTVIIFPRGQRNGTFISPPGVSCKLLAGERHVSRVSRVRAEVSQSLWNHNNGRKGDAKISPRASHLAPVYLLCIFPTNAAPDRLTRDHSRPLRVQFRHL